MKRIMKRAWEIVKTLEGDLRARLSVALKQAWAEARQTKVSKEYYDDGQLKAEYQVNEIGEKDGVYRTYTRNGALFIEGKFINGKRNGIWKQYNYDTDTIKQVRYINGVKVK